MRLLKVEKFTIDLEVSYDDLGILHYALYDYLDKIETNLNHKNLKGQKTEKLKAIKTNLQSMIETINGVI